MREKAAILLLAGCRLALAQQQQLDPAAIAAFIVRRYPLEVVFCVFVMIYALNMLWGFQRNKKRVLEWCETFTEGDASLYARNFALHGTLGSSDALAWRDGRASYQFYATGRRHCGGAVTSVDLAPRQDLLLGVLWQAVAPQKDIVRVEVFGSASTMPHMVLAVGTPRAVRALAKEREDIADLAKPLAVSRERLPAWPAADALLVYAEHSSMFYDLFSEPRILQALQKESLQYFQTLHISSDMPGPNTHRLVFEFVLPPPGEVAALQPLMGLVFAFVDLVAGYKPAAEVRARSATVRKEREERRFAARLDERRDAVVARREAKAAEERARLARMTPAARAKHESKMEKQRAKKQGGSRFKVVKG